MYFSLLKPKIPKSFLKEEKVKISEYDYLFILSKLQKEFTRQYHEFIKFVEIYNYENKNQINLMKRFKDFKKKLDKFIDILRTVYNESTTINIYFKEKPKHTKYSRRWFFNFKKLINRLLKIDDIKFEKCVFKSPVPKFPHFKYSANIRKIIQDLYFELKNSDVHINFTTFWMKLTTNQFTDVNCDLLHLSMTTLRKILREDKRYGSIQRIKMNKKHLFRSKIPKAGIIQFDVKVFGKNQTGMHKYVYLIDAIETRSRMVFGSILQDSKTNSLVNAVKQILRQFEASGIKVKIIQTDNAMVFKNNNFVRSNAFNLVCNQHKIVHRFIPIGEPQADGCIERFHRTIDDELVNRLRKLTSLDAMNDALQKFVEYYNNNRYLHYCELKNLPKRKQYMIPIKSISFFNSYNNAN